MDTSRCVHCSKPIFFGPASPTRIEKQYEKYFDGWKLECWRHTDTDEVACRMTIAEPITKSQCALCSKPIFLGIRSSTRELGRRRIAADDDVVWRHTDGQSRFCKPEEMLNPTGWRLDPVAIPVMNEENGPTFEEIHNELAQGAPERHG